MYGWAFVVAGAVSLNWRHGTTDFHPPLPFTANMAWDKESTLGYPLLVVPSGEALILDLSVAVSVTGMIWYKTVSPGV